MMRNRNIEPGCLGDKIPLGDVVKSLLIREGDTLGVRYRQYFDVAKDVYRDLQLYSIRETQRFWIEVNKKTNSITLPANCLMWTSISVKDDCGRIVPLIQNPNITGDIIDINLVADCGCQCKCESELCGTLKHYEVITRTVTAPMPDGSQKTFECRDRKTIYPNGDFLHEWQEPVVQYDGDVHTATVLEDRKEFICKLAVEECGCVKDCPENRDMISSCCGSHFLTDECCCSCPATRPDELYGSEMFGRTISFDSNFCHDYVLLRFYPNAAGKDIMVPLVAKTAMMRGIMFEMLPYQPGTGYTAMAIQRRQLQFERLYKEERARLFRLLNRFRLKEFYERLLGHRDMPSHYLWNYIRNYWR